MSTTTETLKLQQDVAACHTVHFLPYFKIVNLSDPKNTMNQRVKEETREDYRKFFEFCETNKLLQQYCLSTSATIFYSEEDAQKLFIKQKMDMLTGLVALFFEYIIHIREIHTLAKLMAKDKETSKYDPERALKNTWKVIQDHLIKMKAFPPWDTLSQALQLLPKKEADNCIVKFRDEVIKASAELSKISLDRVERQFFWKN